MKYAFMAAHESEFSVKTMCRILGVQRSGFYAWKQRRPSRREQANQELLVRIREAFELGRNTYGSVRIQKHFLQAGQVYFRHRVARLIKKAHLVPVKAAHWHPQTTRQQPGFHGCSTD